MNAKKAKEARRAAPPPVVPKTRNAQSQVWWKSGRVIFAAAAIVAVVASFTVPGLLGKSSAVSHDDMAMNDGLGTGLRAGSPVPSFSEQDVVQGTRISSKSVFDRKTLIFFSEGVMCQACFEQIKGLENLDEKLAAKGIQLISVTPDPPAELRQAIDQYGIRSPMIADDDRSMSAAFNTLGKGMHGDTPGHSFALIDKGKVLWYRDYFLPPWRTMYVDPEQVLTDIGVKA